MFSYLRIWKTGPLSTRPSTIARACNRSLLPIERWKINHPASSFFIVVRSMIFKGCGFFSIVDTTIPAHKVGYILTRWKIQNAVVLLPFMLSLRCSVICLFVSIFFQSSNPYVVRISLLFARQLVYYKRS